MNISAMKSVVTRGVGRSVLVGKKYSPQVLTAMGIISGVTSTVLAARATLKVEQIIVDHVEDVQLIKYDDNEDRRRKDLAHRYTKTALELTKLYGPAFSVGTFGIVCIISAQGIMQKRNATLTAAYVALEQAVHEYRKRVEAEVGEERERELYHGLEKVNVYDEKGKVVKQVTQPIDPNGISMYARFFDETNPNWRREPQYNLLFLKQHQNFFNDLLHARGHVFLNEVYDALGMERSGAGAVVGWVTGKGDEFVDFGIFDRTNDRARAFVNLDEPSILLDFNVAGPIYQLIEKTPQRRR